jgi:hypothetical protein
VADNPSSPTDETGSVALAEIGAAQAKESARAFLQSGRRNLKEEELDSPAVRRFLLAEIERLDLLCADNQTYVQEYHDQRVEIATLKEGGRKSVSREVLSTVCLSVGFAGLGASPNYLVVAGAERFVWIVIGLSVVLVLSGILSKVWK